MVQRLDHRDRRDRDADQELLDELSAALGGPASEASVALAAALATRRPRHLRLPSASPPDPR
ncbi:hypothetical protein WEI85_09310 [Actinomycetes bacterium KLBMP 9797]